MIEKIKWIGVLLFLMGIIYGSHKLSVAVAANLNLNQQQEEKLTVVIDSGHGGGDPGKIGVNNALEKDINLAIGKKLETALEKENIQVVLTRETDEMLAESKSEDMKKRVQIMNDAKAKLVVSIHQNSYVTEQESGAQVFYYSNSEKGKELALVLQENLKKIDTDNRREAKANDSYYILRHTDVPTVIVECGFLSNWEEAQKLTTEEYQQELAQVICDGILQYIREE